MTASEAVPSPRRRDGRTGCRCCGLRYVEANGYCELCNDKGHTMNAPAHPDERAQASTPASTPSPAP